MLPVGFFACFIGGRRENAAIGVRDFNRYGKVAHASLERAKAYFGIVNVGAVLAALAAVFERLLCDFLAVLIENDAPGERSVLQRFF